MQLLNMKKLLLSIGLLFVTIAGFGQDWQGPSFLNQGIRALALGTNGLGAGGLTNLFLAYTNAGMVHATNLVFTNGSGQVIRSSAQTNTTGTLPLFNTVQFYVDRNGQPIGRTVGGIVAGINITEASASNSLAISSQSLVIETINPLGSNGPVGIVFAPIWRNGAVTVNRSEDWAVILPGLAAARNMMVTNVPTWRWPGAYGLTVRYITNEFGLISAAGTTNCPYLTRLEMIGFKP
jgi:hypothetical protein